MYICIYVLIWDLCVDKELHSSSFSELLKRPAFRELTLFRLGDIFHLPSSSFFQ